MLKGIYFCAETSWNRVYGPDERAELLQLIDIPDQLVTRENWRDHADLLREADVILSTWGGPILSADLLEAMPHLKVYFYGAGDIAGLMTDAAWERGVRITAANSANAIPVAEFALAQIIFSLKRGWEYMHKAKANEANIWGCNKLVPGMYGSRVGIVSIGEISTRLCRHLKHFDVEVYASSPDTDAATAKDLNVRLVDIEELFSTCDVVSIHLRSTHQTRGLIDRSLLNLLKPKASLINTARGEVVNQADLVDFLRKRPDVYACIDVTDPEPPPADCGLQELPNVVLTPHLAGSMNGESLRLSHYMIQELRRYLQDQPLQGEVTREMLERP